MIAPMSRVEIVCLSSLRAEVVAFLHNRGFLHVEDVPLEVEEAPGFLGRVQLEGETREAHTRLEDLERTLSEIQPLLDPAPEPATAHTAASAAAEAVGVVQWTDEQLGEHVRHWSESLRGPTRKKGEIQDALDVLQNYHTILTQVTPALGGRDVTLGKGTRAVVLSGKVNRVAARLEERFQEEIGAECTFHYTQPSRRRLVGLVSVPEAYDETVGRILQQEGIAPIHFSEEEYHGATIGEVIERIEKTLGRHRTTLVEIERDLQDTSKEIGAKVKAAAVFVADQLARLRVQQRFAQSQMITVIHGWTPSDQFARLEEAVEGAFPGKVMVAEIGQEEVAHTQIPTLLRNNGLFRPFEVLLSLFRPPTYGTLDPTALIAVSFIFFYGFILGDVVYGFAVIAFALWLGRQWRHIEAVRSAGIIGVYMGISSIIFGVIYGEYCGNFGHNVLHIPIPFHRGAGVGTTQLLILAILIGVVHVPLALLMGIRESFRHGHTAHVFEKLGMLMGLTAGIIGVLVYFRTEPFGIPVFTGGAATLWSYFAGGLFVVGVGFIFKGMGAMGVVGVIEIISLAGNILSYARLMALGIASIALADIANELPEMLGESMSRGTAYAIGIPAALVVHLMNIGIGMASPTIHSLRLNFVEFLPKFYEPEGKTFTPFRKETQW